jgi:hypothetical protein
MSLTTVVTVGVRPEKAGTYEASVHHLVDRAKAAHEKMDWAARQEIAGNMGTIHFVSEVADWATLAAREPLPIFARRVLGDTEGAKFLDEIRECVLSRTYTIGRDRLDISQPPAPGAEHSAMSLVSLMRVRPGGEDACEELIRKVAQAIPKVKDPRRFVAYQTFAGNPRVYWVVSPLSDLADLDAMLSPQELLLKAFGAEGALIYRTGFEAIEHMERRITVLRPELSLATWADKVSGRWLQRGATAARPSATH